MRMCMCFNKNIPIFPKMCFELVTTTNLLGIDVEYFGGSGAGNGHEAAWVHLARGDTLLPDDGHAVLHAVDAVRDLGEVALPHCLLLGGEGAVVRARALQVVTGTDSDSKAINVS